MGKSTVDLIKERKAKPLKPLNVIRKRKERMGVCASCGHLVYDDERKCPYCQQTIDWSLND